MKSMLIGGSYHRPESKHKQEYALSDATHLKVFFDSETW